jgi:hypothetical protein
MYRRSLHAFLRSPSLAGIEIIDCPQSANRGFGVRCSYVRLIGQQRGRYALLPSASQRLVKLNHCEHFLETDLRQVQLALEQIAIGVKSIELRVHAPAISGIG